MKKLLCALLAVCMLLGMATTSLAEGDKPYKGQEILVFGFDMSYAFNEDGSLKRVLDTNMPIYYAMQEWAELNECTIRNIGGGDATALQNFIASGEVPVLINRSSAFPQLPALDLVEPLPADFVAEINAKYGSLYTDVMQYNGETWGVIMPWASLGSIQYNATKMADLGVKTPKEYYLEGNWTYETWMQCLKECTVDIDGNGVRDTVGLGWSSAMVQEFILPTYAPGEDGMTVNLDSDQARELYNMLYNAYTVDKSISTSVTGLRYGGENNETYAMMRTYLIEPFVTSTLVYADENGDTIETVPVPAWKQGETATQAINVVPFYLGAGANQEAALDLLSYILEVGVKTMDLTSGGVYGFGDLADLQGATEAVVEYKALRDADIADKLAAIQELPEYDPEYIQVLIDYYKTCSFHMRGYKMPGVEGNEPAEMAKTLLTQPTATAMAEIVPVLKTLVDTFNATYAK